MSRHITYDVDTAAKRLQNGGVALLPTDTNYALGCIPWDESACSRLYKIKRRPPEKPLTLFVRDAEEAKLYAALTPAEEHLFDGLTGRFWPGPLNIIVPAGPAAPKHRYFDPGSVSVVCNRNKQLRYLLNAIDSALALTSANISGETVDGLVSYSEAVTLFGEHVDIVVPNDDLGSKTTMSSTIVRIASGKCEIVRQGDIVV